MAKAAAILLAACAAVALITAAATTCVLHSCVRMVSDVYLKKARSHGTAIIGIMDSQCLKRFETLAMHK